MTDILEVYIEEKVEAWAKKNGFLTPKVKFSEAGWPDRLFVSPKGHTIFIEFKRPGLKPKPLQAYRLAELESRGIPAFYVDSVLGGLTILKAALEPASVPEESDSNAPLPGLGGIILGSGTGKDQHGPSDIQIAEAARFRKENDHHCAAAPGLQGVAGRDPKVVGLQQPDLLNPSREGEGTKGE